MKKDLELDDYISTAKSDIIGYIIVTIVIFCILLFIGYKTDFYYILFLDIIMLLRIIERIGTYYNLKLIKLYLTKNNLIDKIGNIDFWNEKNYFLTSNYLIIVQNKVVYMIKYDEIKKIYLEKKLNTGKPINYEEYSHIVTNENKFKILTYSTMLVGEEMMDIKEYLLKKNKNIVIEEDNKKIIKEEL